MNNPKPPFWDSERGVKMLISRQSIKQVSVHESKDWLRQSIRRRSTFGLQNDALKMAGCDVIYEEKPVAKNTERLELEQCRKALRAGILGSLALRQVGRSLPDLVRIVAELERDGIALKA